MSKVIVIYKTCRDCQCRKMFELDPERYFEWQKGRLLQECFPEMLPGDREMLISSYCSSCFDKIFEEDEDTDVFCEVCGFSYPLDDTCKLH